MCKKAIYLIGTAAPEKRYEGPDCLLKMACEKAFYPKGNIPIFGRVLGKGSKNHLVGSEDRSNSGPPLYQ